jgi:hypothetical protein
MPQFYAPTRRTTSKRRGQLRRVGRVVGVGVVGIAVGVGAHLAANGLGGRPGRGASVIVVVGLALAAKGAAQL